MEIKLKQCIPLEDGYYLAKFHANGGLHLVIVRSLPNGERVIIADNCPFISSHDKKNYSCINKGTHLFFNKFPEEAFWYGPIEPKI
jgi:hypothetical protein